MYSNPRIVFSPPAITHLSHLTVCIKTNTLKKVEGFIHSFRKPYHSEDGVRPAATGTVLSHQSAYLLLIKEDPVITHYTKFVQRNQ